MTAQIVHLASRRQLRTVYQPREMHVVEIEDHRTGKALCFVAIMLIIIFVGTLL